MKDAKEISFSNRGMFFALQVAASRVKARQTSAGLTGLQGASRNGVLTVRLQELLPELRISRVLFC